jgi:hypothetical protein
MREDGTRARFVDRTFVTWSPNEDVIAFMTWDSASNRDDRGELVVERPDGTSRRRLVPSVDHQSVFTTGSSRFRSSFLSWSPDGHWIAFTEQVRVIPRDLNGYCDCSEYQVIQRVRADGSGKPEEVYRGELDVELASWDGWSADSRFYLFATRPSTSSGNSTAVFRAGGDTSSTANARPVTPSPVAIYQPWGPLLAAPVDGSPPRASSAHVHWNDVTAIARSPDMRTTAIVNGQSRTSWHDKRIALYDPAGGRVMPLTPPDVAAISPAWSPDATQIAYAAAPETPGVESLAEAAGTLAERRIWLMDRDGKTPAGSPTTRVTATRTRSGLPTASSCCSRV